jgi:CO/xanthine dehydrogenase FAD-binding subunit
MDRANSGYLRRLPKFGYVEAKTIEEACSLLSQYKGEARVIAGGTDLLVAMKMRQVTPNYVIDLRMIPDLDYIYFADGEGLRIGALATLCDIESLAVIRERFPVLADAASKIANPQIRNMGTIGGNLCNAAPSADMAPPLIGLGAEVKIKGLKGERVIPLEGFFVGPGESALQIGEILTEIRVPSPSPRTQALYLKLSARTAIDIAVVGVAAVVTLDSKGTRVTDVRIVLGAVAPTPIRAHQAEGIIKGGAIDEHVIERASQAAADEAKPISDVRGSAIYRKEMVKVLTKRAIRQLVAFA